jgi:hypothetical protein
MGMVLVGTFGPGNTYSGRTVSWDAGVFTIDGLGATSLEALLQSDDAGQFEWASAETRAWAESQETPAVPGPGSARGPFRIKPWMLVAAAALVLAIVGTAIAVGNRQQQVLHDPPLDKFETSATPGVNNAPVAVDDSYTTAQDTQLTVLAAEGVLANDTDADGDTLSLTQSFGPLHGAAIVAPDGSFIYTPTAGYSGSDYLTYSVSDGRGGTAAGAADISVTPVTHTNPDVVVPPKVKPVYTKHAQVRAGFFTLVIPIMGPYGTMNIYDFQCWFYAQSGGKIVGSKSSIFKLTQSEINRHAVSKTSARTKLLNALVSRMKKAGWTVTGRGAEWFAIKLSK